MNRSWIGAAFVLLPAVAVAGPAPIGTWRVGDGAARIRISQCGERLCGAIVWTRGRGGKDENNPDPIKRNRPLVGLQILDLAAEGPGLWTGTVYNAKTGQDYSARLRLKSKSVLRLEGCVKGTSLCGEESWTRVR